jgi:hypothetical protein
MEREHGGVLAALIMLQAPFVDCGEYVEDAEPGT